MMIEGTSYREKCLLHCCFFADPDRREYLYGAVLCLLHGTNTEKSMYRGRYMLFIAKANVLNHSAHCFYFCF